MVNKKLLLINVLSKDVFDDCHIKGSINVPINQLEAFAQPLDRDQKIVVYCASYACNASIKAWRLLDAMGFQNLWAYEGGMAEWYHAGLPVHGVCQAPYLSGKVERSKQDAKDVKQIYIEELKFLMEEQGLLNKAE